MVGSLAARNVIETWHTPVFVSTLYLELNVGLMLKCSNFVFGVECRFNAEMLKLVAVANVATRQWQKSPLGCFG